MTTAHARPAAAVLSERLVVRTRRSDHQLKAGTTYRIGRDPKSDIIMTDSRVSWRHAELRIDGDGWIIEDLGSTNGTFLGQERLGRIQIRADCVVRLGIPDDGPVLRCMPQAPAAPPVPAAPPPDHPGTALSVYPARPAPQAPPAPEAHPGAAPRHDSESWWQPAEGASPASPPVGVPFLPPVAEPTPTPPEPARPRPGAAGQPPGRTAAEAPTRFIMRPARHRPVVAALVPAWNEEEFIAATIDGLRSQTRPPDLIVVIANNCTDDTAEAARAAGAEVIEMPRNPHRKAGALNYGIETLLASLADKDRIFVMDADTVIVPRFFELANAVMDADPRAVVSGRYACRNAHGLIGLLQRNEFARECRMTDRRGDRTHILVGTSALLPVAMLREVIAARASGTLPPGYVYLPGSLTEDFELTLAAKTLGWQTISPFGCDAATDTMPTWRKLWLQRIRWMQGGVEDLRRYGWTRVTAPFHVRRAWILFGLAAMWLFYATVLATWASAGTVVTSRPWALLTLVFIADRVGGVRAQGTRSMLLAALLVPEIIYNMFAQVVYVTALYKAFRGGPSTWHET